MRDAWALHRKLCGWVCVPVLVAGCDDNRSEAPVKSQPKWRRANPPADPAPRTSSAVSRTRPSSPSASPSASPPAALPADPEQLRLLPIPGDPPYIDGYSAEEASCPSGNWCGPIVAAQALVPRAGAPKLEMGCPTRIVSATEPGVMDAKVYAGLSRKSNMQGALNRHGTELARAAGTENACCYHWFEYCSGRPLLGTSETVSGAHDLGLQRPTVAATAYRGDWTAGLAGHLAPSPIADELGHAWLADAAAEHASVAAFGRVALELLAVGAPPALLEETLQAARDEVLHAQACYAIASHFLGRSVGPGTLATPPARAPNLSQVAADTFVEGCVGETTAALVALRAQAATNNEAIANVLEQIAADETRHAALAWKTVRWAVSTGGAEVATALRRAHAMMQAQTLQPTPGHPDWNRMGRLSRDQLRDAIRDARRHIVTPMLEAVLARQS